MIKMEEATEIEETIPGMPREKLEKFLGKLKQGVDFRQIFKDMRERCYRPAGYSIDPRGGDEIIFSTSRDKRPTTFHGEKCVLCEGDENEILPFLMAQELSSGAYAFVNENKYAFLNPDATFIYGGIKGEDDKGIPLRGGNFLVWPTTQHMEIHELPYKDHEVSFRLMSHLEEILLSRIFDEDFGFKSVQIIKNTASAIPGSHIHGPYQVTVSNRFVRKINNDIRFLEKEGRSFVQFIDKDISKDIDKDISKDIDKDISKDNPALLVGDYGTMRLAVHRYTRRPLEAVIYPKDMHVQSLCDLNDEQIADLARVTSDVSFALSLLMPAMKFGGHPSEPPTLDYCFAFHTGPIGTMYIEVYPSSQRPGGFERLGRYIYQGTPHQSAQIYRNFLKIFGPGRIITRYDLDSKDPYTLNLVYKQVIEPALEPTKNKIS